MPTVALKSTQVPFVLSLSLFVLTVPSLAQIMDVDEEWAQQIRMRKFEIYNEDWMQAIEEDAQLEAYYDGGGDEADLEARIGAALLSIGTSFCCLLQLL